MTFADETYTLQSADSTRNTIDISPKGEQVRKRFHTEARALGFRQQQEMEDVRAENSLNVAGQPITIRADSAESE